MSVKNERDRARQVQERCQRLLNDLLKDDDNKYCVDCDAKGPRWASWNIGIFLCIRCAGIHRNLGVHISKVKSVNLDSWTPEQVVSLQQMGNSRARAVYEANLPDAFRRPQTDSALEAFIRAKYEHRKYVAREWVPPSPPQVNWDKEIDEEIEKSKKKKRSSSSTSSITSGNSSSTEKKSNKSAINAVPKLLPKPKSSVSPKPGRSTPKREVKATADLLDTNATNTNTNTSETSSQNNFTDDMFSSFLSAPQTAQDTNKNTSDSKATDLKSEEESFFNQPAPSEKEKSKMTKDSILALYGQAPLKNVSAPFVPQNGAFISGFPQQPFQPSAFGQSFAYQQSAGYLQNGTMQIPGSVQPQSFPSGFNQYSAVTSMQNTFNNQYPQNQFLSLQNFSTAPLSSANSNQLPNSGHFSTTNIPSNVMNGSQSFFGTQPGNNLAQQFGGMSLTQNPSVGMNNFPVQQNNTSGNFPSTAQTNLTTNGVWP